MRTPIKRASITAVALGLMVALFTGCMQPHETNAFQAINADRAANGVGGLGENGALIEKAQNWAVYLASNSGGRCSGNTLVHSDLRVGAPEGWRALGENVGCRVAPGGDLTSHVGPLQSAFMNSKGHRDNILNGNFNAGGVGIAAVPAADVPGWLAVYEVQEFGRV